jgi:hypothetical protein
MNFKACVAAAATLVGMAGAQAAVTTINFDDAVAPCLFSEQAPLSNQYAAQGVTFQAVGGPAMEVLDQCGGFSFSARSGNNFLAYNTALTSNQFDAIITASLGTASIWAASSQQGGTATLQAYDVLDNLIASASVSLTLDWQQLAVSGADIAYLRLSSNTSAGAFDDLQFDAAAAVPEPISLALVSVALLGLGLSRRRPAR